MKFNILSRVLNILKGIDKYILLSLLGLVVIYVVNIIGIELLSLKPQLTYFIATSINLIICYFGYLRIFQQPSSKSNLIKFILNLVVFFGLNNILFNIWVSQFSIHYLIAIAFNMVIFPVAKFLSYKYIVFRTHYG